MRYWHRGFFLRAAEKSRHAAEQPLTRRKRDVKSSKGRQKLQSDEGRVDRRENKRNRVVIKKEREKRGEGGSLMREKRVFTRRTI